MQTAVPYMHEATKYVGPLLSPRHAEVLHVGRVPTRYHFQSQGNREALETTRGVAARSLRVGPVMYKLGSIVG
jgi:hypothetical protein